MAIGYESDEPAGQPPTVVLTTQVESVTTPDGTAREFLTNQVQFATGPDVSFRGEVLAETMTEPVVDGDTAQATICVATVVANAVEGGRDLGKSDVYAPHEVVYVRDGDSWVMADIALSEEADDTPATPAICIPPTLEAELTEAWNGYVSASNAYNRDTSNEEAAAAFSDVLVGSVEPEPNTVSQSWTEDVYARLEIASASPTMAHMSWCMDISLDPDAKFIFEDGTSQPGWNQAWTGDWVPDDGEWKLETFRQAIDEPEEPLDGLKAAWNRCFP